MAASPPCTSRWVLADSLAVEVASLLEHSAAYDPVRLAGSLVIAKTIPLNADASHSAIVFDASLWRESGGAAVEVYRVGLVAHELGHTIIHRAAAEAGARRPLPEAPTTDDIAVEIGNAIADEYRADRLAEIVVGQVASIGEGEQAHPLRSWEDLGPGYVNLVRGNLETADDDWGAFVGRGARHDIEPSTAWILIAAQVQDTLIALIHAQAWADHADLGMDIVTLPEIASLPGTAYLAKPLVPFLAALRRLPIIAPVEDTSAVEAGLAEAGATMLHGILEVIGLRPIRAGRTGRIVVGRLAWQPRQRLPSGVKLTLRSDGRRGVGGPVNEWMRASRRDRQGGTGLV